MHRTAMRIETEVQLNIHDAFQEKKRPLGEKEMKALTSATKILHFLITHNIPHTTVFKDLIDFATDELKCPDLQHLRQGNNATYTSPTIVGEFMDSMVTEIEEKVKDRVNESPGYAIMCDETTDISNKKHLAFCVKYVEQNSGETCIDYVKDVRVDDGKAETIFNETKAVVEDLGLDKFVAFGSDGCNTMIGKKTGVATRLKELKPEIVTVHCHNHRLALAAKDSFESIKVMRDTDDLLSHLFKYYHSSGNRTGSLERIQRMLEDSGKKIKQAGHTRWLSHLEAVTSLRDSYQAVLMDLENATAAGTDKVRLGCGPTAHGMLKKLKTYEAVQIIHFLCDALKPVTTLALVFERNDVDLSIVKPRLVATTSALIKLKTAEGLSNKKAQKIIIDNNIKASEQQMQHVAEAKSDFIDNLTQKIKARLSSSDIIDNMAVFNMENTDTFYGNDEVSTLAEHFGTDPDKTVEEWETLKDSVTLLPEGTVKGPQKVMKVFTKLRSTVGDCFNNIEKICAAAAVVPVSTAEVERVFSEVTRTKTDIRNRLEVDSVHKLLMIHRNDRYLDFERVVLRWYQQKNRRI